MLVKVCGYVINTRNITLIEEIKDDVVKVYFVSGYAEYVELEMKMGDLIEILGVVDNG